MSTQMSCNEMEQIMRNQYADDLEKEWYGGAESELAGELSQDELQQEDYRQRAREFNGH